MVSAEIEVNLALQRYRQLFEVASEWFWETDAGNRVTYVSSNIEAVLGLPPSEYCGKRLADTEGVLIDPEAGRTSLAEIKTRQPYRDFIYSRKLPNGKTVWINSSGAPFYGRDGAFLGYRGIARDVTAQLEAERRSRETEQQFQQLFEIAADHCWEVDAQQRVTYISPTYEALTGISPANVVGKRLDENPNISIAPEMRKMAVRAIKAGQPYRDFVYSYVTQPIVVYNGENRVVAFNQAFAELHRVPNINTPVCQGVSFCELLEWQQKVGFHANGPDDEIVAPGDLLEVFRNGQEHTYHLWDGRWMLVMAAASR